MKYGYRQSKSERTWNTRYEYSTEAVEVWPRADMSERDREQMEVIYRQPDFDSADRRTRILYNLVDKNSISFS